MCQSQSLSVLIMTVTHPKKQYSIKSIIIPIYFIIFAVIIPLISTTTDVPKPPNFRFLPGLTEDTYSNIGDINIGIFMNARGSTGPAGDTCSKYVYNTSFIISATEEFVFAVDVVNKTPNLLPNVTLGFIMRDWCYSSKIALATSLSFLPRTQKVCNDTVCYTQALLTTDTQYHSHDVIGVVAPYSSDTSVPISSLYGVAHLPLMGYVTTSDELSDKWYHPYFFRVVPPDKYNVQALLKFISMNGWSYISVVYSSGTYGEKAFDSMKLNVDSYGICIATSHRLTYSTDYEELVSDLLHYPRARVVVLFTGIGSFFQMLQITINKNATGHFIWMGTDSIARYRGYDYEGLDYDPAIGTFTFDLFSTYVPEYYEYLRNQTLSTTKNPFLPSIWEYLFQCSFKNGTCNTEANILESDQFIPNDAMSLKVDSVLAFAHAAHNLLSEKCPEARGTDARACITGELLLQYLKNVSFEGYSGHIEFDDNQDMRGKYIISQFVYDYYKYPYVSDDGGNATFQKRIWKKHIGIYDISTHKIIYFNETISWSHLNNLTRIVPWKFDSTSSPHSSSSSSSSSSYVSLDIPESVCSRPCLISEYKIEKELPCCWECRICRENERIVAGNTSCERCPAYMWPDPMTAYQTCIPIPLTYPKLSQDLLPVILLCLGIFAIAVTALLFVGYILYRNERVVKAGSRELSLLQLVAIFVGYVTVLVFQTKPTDATCATIFFMFSMSFAWLYAPLLVKTVRIYRIFRSGIKNNRRPRYVSPKSQIIMAACLIAVQVILCLLTFFVTTPSAHLNQPIWSEKLVELSCDLTVTGLASFLSYNLVLVCLCSVFAFKTRKLPDNFNESKFISMCVSTTLVIWLAFIPTYFTADREAVRVLLLSTALLLNHSVALLFLFIPKLYAAIFLPPEAPGNFNATTRFQTTVSIFTSRNSSRVAPAETSTITGGRPL